MRIDDNTQQVIQNALGLAKDGAVEIYNRLQQVAPELWKMALRQTLIEGIECAFGALVILLAAIVCWTAAKRWIDDTDFKVGATVAGFVCLAIFVGLTIKAVDFIGNPAYWTLKNILDLVKH